MCKRHLIFLIISLNLTFVLFACGNLWGTQESPEFSELVEVKVDKAGSIYYDGQAITIEELREKFNDLNEANGAVIYYRELIGDEPHPNAMEVLELLIEAKLPIRFSETDFD